MSANFQDTESVLIKRVSEGDASAFSDVFKFYSGTVFNTVMVYVKDRVEAEEIVQRIFIKLWERRAALSAVVSFRDYLFIAVRNAVFNYFNQQSSSARFLSGLHNLQAETAVDDADHRLRQKEYERLLERAIQRLPPQQRQVWLFAEREALTYDDIAQRMGISRLTVKKHLELARRSVRNCIHILLKDELIFLVLAVVLPHSLPR